jgi:hypothetical protein
MVAPPPSPPPIAIVRSIDGSREVPTRLETFRVEIKMAKERLWVGELTASDLSAASFNQGTRTAASQCLEDGAWHAASFDRNEDVRFTISIPRNYGRNPAPDPDSFAIDVRRQRALPDCNGGGQATVSFQRPVVIKVGETEEVTGDAGLAVRITRLAQQK